MGTGLRPEDKAKKDNAYQLPRIGFFNDTERDAVKGLIDKEFVEKYIDKIFVTPGADGSMSLQIKIFTGKTTEKVLQNLRSRTGHTVKKMIESYEKSL